MLRRPLTVVRSRMIDAHEMTLDESAIIDTCFLAAYTAGQLWYATIRAHLPFPSRRILTLGLAGSALCVAAFGLLPFPSAVVRCVLWAALGLVQAVGWASCLVVLTPWLEPSERGTVMGVWGTNMALGGVLGNGVSARVLTSTDGSWSSVFVVCAMLAGAAALVMPWWLAPHPNAVGLRTAAQAGDARFAGADARSPSDIEGEWIAAARQVATEMDTHNNQQQHGAGDCKSNGSAGTNGATGNDSSNSGGVAVPIGAASSNTGNASSHDRSNSGSNSNGSGNLFHIDSSTKEAMMTGHVSRIPGVLGIAVSYFFHKLVRYVLMMWLPFYLTRTLNIDAASAAYMSTSFDFGGIFGTVGAGYLADFFGGGGRKALTVSMLAVVMSATLLAFAVGLNGTSSFLTLTLCFVAGGCGFGIDSLMTGSLLQDHCDKLGVSPRIGAVGAFVGAIGTLGSILQGPFTVVFAAMSWGSLFVLMVVMTGVALVALLPVVRMETMKIER
jgi:sugar phosphate permease